MDPAFPLVVPPLAAAIIAVMAASLGWLVATPLLRATDSPILPERLLRWMQQQRFLAALAYTPMIFAGWHAAWALPLAWLGLQITVHRVRRAVYGDTWSLAGQVRWNARAFLALWAWWWTVLAAPAVLIHAEAPPAAVLATGALLGVWWYFYNDLLGAILGAKPIVAPTLLEAFEPVLARATIPRPRLLHAGPSGGLVINACALANLRRDTILFFDGLLDEMTPAESAAVLAHELGHLEDFATRRWQFHGMAPLLVAGLVLATLGVQRFDWPAWFGTAWFAVPGAVLLFRVAQSQRRETESDRRAVELCGDGETLIRALAAIYSRARMPRRLQPEMAQRATHPSLGRRIQAIRAASGVAPGPLEPRAFAADGVPRAIVFEADRLVFVSLGDDPPALADLGGLVLRARQVDALPYAELASLHVEPRRDDGATLVATDRHGDARRIRIADRDVAAVQALLDVVDQRIGPPPVVARPPQLLGRVAAMTAFVFALPVYSWGVVGAAVLALVRPTTPLLAAISAGVLATAAIRLRHPSSAWEVPWVAAIGLVSASLVVRQHRGARASGTRFRFDGFLVAGFVVTGAAAAIPAWLILALGHTELGRMHVAARAFASAAAGFAALGGLCLVVPRRLARIAAVAAFTLAAAIAAVGSDTFRDHVVPDPLIARAPPLVVQDLDLPADGTISAAGTHWYVTLAPDAQHVLLIPDDDSEDDSEDERRYTVADFDGWHRDIDAAYALFVDAGTLLVARWEKRTLVLSAEPVRAAEPRWTLRVDDVPRGNVDVDASGHWRVDPDVDADSRDDAIRLEGRVGDAAFTRTPLRKHDTSSGAVPDRGVAASGAAIAVSREFAGNMHRLGWLLPDLPWRSVLERTGGAAPGVLARSRVALDCYGPSMTSASATCLARTGDDTFVWEVPADAGSPRPLATLTGHVVGETYEARALLLWHEQDLLMLWRGTNQALRIARRGHCPCAYDGSYASGHVATLTRVGDREVVRRYAMAPPDGAAPR